jgi:CHASE2 domain-containing sensor protein
LKTIWKIFNYLDWRQWEREKRIGFFINISVGIAVGGIFLYFSHLQRMEKLFNATIDRMIHKETAAFMNRWERCVIDASKGKECSLVRNRFSDKIVFIDIDHDTYMKWGEPLIFQRSRIADFIRVAEKNDAKVVVFDILFDYPSFAAHEDYELRSVLEEMTRRKSSLKIVFPVILRNTDRTIKKNIYEDIIDRNPNFQCGVPYLSLSKTDKVIRYIRYYDVADTGKGEKRVLWSVPLLAWALYKDTLQHLKNLEPAIINDVKLNRREHYGIERAGQRRIDVSNSELFSNRIRFSLLPPGTLDGEGNLFTERILPDELDALQKELNNKIVIIGTSSKDKEGWYPTPIGEMAGFYIIGNAINMMVSNWQVRDTPLWVTFLLEFFLIVTASYLFVYFRAKTVRRGAAFLVIAVLVPVTYYFYSTYGIFINVVVIFMNCIFPILAMNWKTSTEDIKETVLTIQKYYGNVKIFIMNRRSRRKRS